MGDVKMQKFHGKLFSLEMGMFSTWIKLHPLFICTMARIVIFCQNILMGLFFILRYECLASIAPLLTNKTRWKITLFLQWWKDIKIHIKHLEETKMHGNTTLKIIWPLCELFATVQKLSITFHLMTHENSKGQAYLNCKGGLISESLSLQKYVPSHYPKLLFTWFGTFLEMTTFWDLYLCSF